jgi:predicted dehydrogenase
MGNGGILRAGIIGLGIGEQHVRAYQSVEGVEVFAVCDLDSEKADAIARQYDVKRRETDWRLLTEDPDIDVISIASYDNIHAEQVVSALENGKHVFIEKPMCLTPDEAEAIKQALDAHPDLKLSSNLPLRTCPRFKRLRDEMQSGAMGDVYHLEADYLWGRSQKLTNGWRREMPFYSIVLGASIHMIDLILWFKGEAPIEVSGHGSRIALAKDQLGFDDFAVNTLHFADGTFARVSAHGGCAHPHFHAVRAYGTELSFHHGLNGAYWVDSSDPSTTPKPETADYPARNERRTILASFLAYIRDSRKTPLVTAADAFLTMDIALAADRAIREGRAQQIS